MERHCRAALPALTAVFREPVWELATLASVICLAQVSFQASREVGLRPIAQPGTAPWEVTAPVGVAPFPDTAAVGRAECLGPEHSGPMLTLIPGTTDIGTTIGLAMALAAMAAMVVSAIRWPGV